MAAGSHADAAFRHELTTILPSLRAFAFTLCWQRTDADDLVQDTVIRALDKQHLFQPGTNLRAWTMTLMRNQYYNTWRKRRPEVEDVNGVHAEQIAVPAAQAAGLMMGSFHAALGRLPPDQREALILIGAADHSYEEAAAICGVPTGTIKSRVHRARQFLIRALGLADATDLDLSN